MYAYMYVNSNLIRYIDSGRLVTKEFKGQFENREMSLSSSALSTPVPRRRAEGEGGRAGSLQRNTIYGNENSGFLRLVDSSPRSRARG